MRHFAARHDPEGPSEEELQRLTAALAAYAPGGAARAGPLAIVWNTNGARAQDAASTCCVLDGRVTNTAALAAALSLERGTEPERVLAVGYERWGEGLAPRLQGEWAFIAWNTATGEGMAARDRTGGRPLFLLRDGRSLLLGSEVRLLLAASRTRPPPDRLAVAHWLARTIPDDTHTLYAGIERLRPGCLIRLSSRGVARRPYWEPTYEAPTKTSREEARILLREGIESAVDRALPGEGLGAVLLSGGFDSATVAAVARGRVRAYSGVFPNWPEVDESVRIAAVREQLGLAGVELRVTGGSALRSSLEFLEAWELPCAAPNWFVWDPLLRRAAENGRRVVLDGEGGDELFGCSPYLLSDRILQGRWIEAIRLARNLPGMGPAPRARWIRAALVRYGARGAVPGRIHAASRRPFPPKRYAPAWLESALAHELHERHDPWAWKRRAGPRWWAWLVGALLAAPEAMGAPDQLRREAELAGVQARQPLRDFQLVGLVLSLPPEFAFGAALDRPLARQSMRGLVPDAVRLSDAKVTFNAVLASALSGPDRPAIERILGDSKAEVRAFVKPGTLDDVLRGSPEGGRGLDLWRLLTLECWLRLQDDRRFSATLRNAVAPAGDADIREVPATPGPDPL